MAGKYRGIKNPFKHFHSKYKNRKFYPFNDFASIWTFIIGISFFGLLIIAPILGKITIYPGDYINSQNRLYLLSAVAQSLAAILALGVSAALVSVQLVSQMFTPKVIRLKLCDFYFWLFIGLYVVTILWTLSLMGWLNRLIRNISLDRQGIDIGLLLMGASILYLIPFIQTTIKNLQPVVFIQKFLARGEFPAVEEALHSAVDEGFSTIIKEAGQEIRIYTLSRMANEGQETRSTLAQKAAQCFLNVGKRAFRKKEDECVFSIFEHLKSLTIACTEKVWRREADIFNDALTELYDFTQEQD